MTRDDVRIPAVDHGVGATEKPKLLHSLPANPRRRRGLLGHHDVSTAVRDTHVLNRGGVGVRSPADQAGLADLTAVLAD